MILSAASGGKGWRARFERVAFGVFAVLFCAMAFSFLSVGAAQAHVMHSSAEAQNASEATPGVAVAGVTVAATENGCAVDCCSVAHCAAGVVVGPVGATVVGATAGIFVLPVDAPDGPNDPNTLIRPPRS